MAGIAFEHSIQFPDGVRPGQKRGDVRQTFRETLRPRYRRELERVVAEIKQGYSDYPEIAQGFHLRQQSGPDEINFSIEQDWDRWWVLEYNMPPHEMPPNPHVPIENLIVWAASLGMDVGFAYYVADKIGREGFTHPGTTGVGAVQDALQGADARLQDSLSRAIARWAERFGAYSEGGS